MTAILLITFLTIEILNSVSHKREKVNLVPNFAKRQQIDNCQRRSTGSALGTSKLATLPAAAESSKRQGQLLLPLASCLSQHNHPVSLPRSLCVQPCTKIRGHHTIGQLSQGRAVLCGLTKWDQAKIMTSFVSRHF